MLVTFSELAKLKGVSLPAVSRAVKDGRIIDAVVINNGKKFVDSEMALRLWEERTKPKIEPHLQHLDPDGEKPRSARKAAKAIVENTPGDAIPSLHDSKAKREFYLAALARLQVDEQKGELISAADAKKSAFTLGRSIREALQNLADRVSYELAGESDETVIHRILTKEHRQALEDLARVAN